MALDTTLLQALFKTENVIWGQRAIVDKRYQEYMQRRMTWAMMRLGGKEPYKRSEAMVRLQSVLRNAQMIQSGNRTTYNASQSSAHGGGGGAGSVVSMID